MLGTTDSERFYKKRQSAHNIQRKQKLNESNYHTYTDRMNRRKIAERECKKRNI
jgi:hypothetical protein